MAKQKRVNKSKAEIEQIMKMTQNADRMRVIVKDKLFPLLQKMNVDVRYAKTILHTCSVAVEQAFNEKRKTTTVKDLELLKLFDQSSDKTAVYTDIFNLLADEDINSFQLIVRDLPDNIDRYYFTKGEKNQFNDINVDELLG